MSSHYIIGSDFDCETETLYDLTEAFDESIGANTTLTSASCGFSIESIAGSLEMVMGLYGGLFFSWDPAGDRIRFCRRFDTHSIV